MSAREEEERISPWNTAYRRSISTASSPNYEYLREKDIADTYKLMERPSVMEELEQHRDMLINRLDAVKMRGTCGPEDSAQKEFEEYIKPQVEDEEEEFLFDPKELDI